MASEPATNGPGKALRVYQIILILGLGWVAGRLPDLFRSNVAEQVRQHNALGGNAFGIAAQRRWTNSELRTLQHRSPLKSPQAPPTRPSPA